jgi:glucose-1-phosphate adenylyltransferase
LRDVIVLVLGGGQGRRLRPLTSQRAKPAVPVGGKYRLIDIPVSNCIHSDLKRIYVLTQFMSASLHNHLMQTYRFDGFSDGFVHILAAQQEPQRMDWFQGTADAVRRCQRHFSAHRPRKVLILSGDQVYNMDFEALLDEHDRSGSDVTIGAVPVPAEDAPGLGILRTDADGRIVDFVEKPKDAAALAGLEADPAYLAAHNAEGRGEYLANMGVYVFDPVALADLLADADKTDFGKEIIPQAIREFKVSAYPFGGYWCDVGTIRSFYDANLELAKAEPRYSFHEPGFEVFTRARHLPPSKVRDSRLDLAYIAEGCEIVSSEIRNSVVGIRTRVGKGSRITNSVLLGEDFYETPDEIAAAAAQGLPAVGIGEACVIERAIIDKDARIGDGVVITDKTGRPDFEGTNYWIRDGIVVVPRLATIAAGTRI